MHARFTQIKRIELEWFATRHEAEAAEWKAIRNECPLHNHTFNRKAPIVGDPIQVLDRHGKPIANCGWHRPKIKLKPRLVT